MFALLKLIQSIIKTLHSDGTPGQVAAGIALGSALGLTPLVNVHNLIVFALIVLLNVSFGGGMLGWALFVPLGFLLDPVVRPDRREPAHGALAPAALDLVVQHAARARTPTSTTPSCSAAWSPGWCSRSRSIFARAGTASTRYRATIGERVRQSKLYKAVTASQVYNWYKLFRPS